MTKKLILLCLLLQGVFFANSKTVSINTLKTLGSNFLASKGLADVKSGLDLTLVFSGTGAYKGTSVTALYVFNVNSGNGWIMMSADDLVKPVLAYSGKSSFDIHRIAPSTLYWIQGYENQAAYVIINGTPAKAGVAGEWKDLVAGVARNTARTTAVAPMIATAWDQEPYYNDSCPYDYSSSQLTVTGCVATAMAQVMRFWEWPTVGCGNLTYSDPPYGNLNANFGGSVYQWALMPASISAPNAAIAKLMFDAGVSVEMSYGTDVAGGSGAFVNTIESNGTPCAEYALKANFHYKQSLHSLIRFGEGPGSGYDSIAEATWISELQADLALRHPIVYAGSNPSLGGHCWVCDGFDAANYFHFNWGWSGSSDGYYTVDNLAPPALGVGGGSGNFDYDQTAIVGIVPDSFPSNPGNIQLLSSINTSNTPFPYTHPFSVAAKIINSDSVAFSGDFCARVYDTAGNFSGTIQTITGETITAGDSTPVLTFASTGMYNLVTGIYSVRLYYRPTGDTSWTPVANNGNFINFTYMSVYNDTDIELSNPMALSPGIVLRQLAPVSLNANISNWGNDYFNGNLKATLNSLVDGSVVFTIQELTGQEIAINSTDSFWFNNASVTAPLGNYVLEISHQYGSSGNFFLTGSTYASNPVLVTVAEPSAVTQVNKSGNVNIYPDPASDRVTVAIDGSQDVTITVLDMQGRALQRLNGVQQTVCLDVFGYASGMYFIQIQTGDDLVTRKFTVIR